MDNAVPSSWILYSSGDERKTISHINKITLPSNINAKKGTNRGLREQMGRGGSLDGVVRVGLWGGETERLREQREPHIKTAN